MKKSGPNDRVIVNQNYLGPTLRDLGIKSFCELDNYIARKSNNHLFKIQNNKTLRLDGESRTHENNINFDWELITCSVKIKNSSTIKFKDSIVKGDIIISDPEKKLKSISFDYVIVEGMVVVNIENLDRLSISKLNCKKLIIRGGCAGDVSVSSCTIFDLYIQHVEFKDFFTYRNRIVKFNVNEVKLDKFTFDHRQIDVSMIACSDKTKKYQNRLALHDYFSFGFDDDSLEYFAKSTFEDDVQDTISFLLEKTAIQLDRSSLVKVRKTNFELYASHSKFAYAFMRATGGFTSPWLFFLYIVGIWIAFSGIYCFLNGNGASPDGLSMSGPDQAFYFSGVTLFTIGYGDILPQGISKWLAVLEGMLGVVLISAFTVSLYRKYVEK